MTGASPDGDRAGGPADPSRCPSRPKALIPSAGDRFQSTGYCMYIDYELDENRDPTVERWRFRNAEDEPDDGEGWMIVTVREVVATEHCGTLVVFHRQWFAPDGEPLSRGRRCIFGLPGFRGFLSRHTATLQGGVA